MGSERSSALTNRMPSDKDAVKIISDSLSLICALMPRLTSAMSVRTNQQLSFLDEMLYSKWNASGVDGVRERFERNFHDGCKDQLEQDKSTAAGICIRLEQSLQSLTIASRELNAPARALGR